MSDWAKSATCLNEDPEMFFLTAAQAESAAKQVCRRCPVAGECLQYAMESGIDYGTWGGLSEKERRALRRRKSAKLTAEDIEDVRQPATLKEAWEARTRKLDGGHLGWSGNPALYFQGVSYTPRRAAFLVSRGTKPYGQVLSVCGVDACIRPDHLADAQERHLLKVAVQGQGAAV